MNKALQSAQAIDREDHREEGMGNRVLLVKSLNNETEVGKCRTGLQKQPRLSLD